MARDTECLIPSLRAQSACELNHWACRPTILMPKSFWVLVYTGSAGGLSALERDSSRSAVTVVRTRTIKKRKKEKTLHPRPPSGAPLQILPTVPSLPLLAVGLVCTFSTSKSPSVAPYKPIRHNILEHRCPQRHPPHGILRIRSRAFQSVLAQDQSFDTNSSGSPAMLVNVSSQTETTHAS